MKESVGLIGLIGLIGAIGLEVWTDGLCAGSPSSSLCGVWGLSIGGIVGALLGSLGVCIPVICSGQEDCVPLPLQIAKEAFAEVSIMGL